MALWNIIGNLVGGGIKHYSDYKTVTRKKEIELAKKETDLSRFRSAQHDGSWKDELLVILVFGPWVLILMGMVVNILFGWLGFFFDVQPYLDQYFSLLEGIPDWYKYLMGSIVASVFGFKYMRMKK